MQMITEWNDYGKAIDEFVPDAINAEDGCWWDWPMLRYERMAWKYRAKGRTEERYRLLGSFEGRQYQDDAGESHDVFDWIDRMNVYTFRPFTVESMNYTELGKKSGKWMLRSGGYVHELRITARNEEEALRIATADIIYQGNPGFTAFTAVKPALEIESEGSVERELEGFELEPEYDWKKMEKGESPLHRVYDLNDVQGYWDFLDDFARKFSKSYHLYPVSEEVRKLYYRSDSTEGFEWTRKKNLIDLIDPYILTPGRIQDTREKAEAGDLVMMGTALCFCRRKVIDQISDCYTIPR